MRPTITRTRLIGLYVGVLILTLSVIGRAAPEFYLVKYEWAVFWGPAIFLALFLTEGFITKRIKIYPHVYFTIQSAITFALLQLNPAFDYFAILFVMLAIQAMWILPRRSALIWNGIFGVGIVAGLLFAFGLEGIGFILAYLVVGVLVSFFGLVSLDAEQSRNEAQRLLAELQVAHAKLQDYARQAEELAAIQQRAALARELHDSVTQTIFSMTLTAQAARMLLNRDPSRVAAQLEHLQELSQNALSEMRSLIQQMRAKPLEEEGLASAVRRHCEERQKNDGLRVELNIEGEQRLPLAYEEGLFRIIQEGLNNIIKHARTDRAVVNLNLAMPPYSVTIEDQGAGFNFQGLDATNGHVGLSSISERARAIGGTFSIESAPGKGTRIRIDNIQPKEAASG